MVEIRPGVSQDSIEAILDNPRAIERAFLDAGVAPIRAKDVVGGGTLFVDGEPKMAAGVLEVGPKIGLAWLLSSIDLKPHIKQVLRAIRTGMRQAEARGFRLIARVHADQPTAVTFIEHLGFANAGTPTKDGHQLYVKRN